MTKTFIPLIFFSSVLLVMLLFILTVFLIIHRQRQKQHQMELHQIFRNNQYALLRTRMDAQENVLKSISREIHDNIGQVLASSQMKLLAWEEYWTRDKELGPVLKEVASRMQKATSDLRNLSHILHRGVVEKAGLIASIKKELEYVRSVHKLSCKFQYNNYISSLSPFQNMQVFRIVQEVIMNVVKHAQARKLILILNVRKGQFRMILSDDGIGMQPNGTGSKGLGLQSIQERINLLSGRLKVASGPGKGTTIFFTFKLTENEQKPNMGRRSGRSQNDA